MFSPRVASLALPLALGLAGCASRPPPTSWQKVALAASPPARMRPLLEGPPKTGGMQSGHVTLPAGQSMHRHSTEEYEEAIVVLAGRARIVVGAQVVEVAAGELLYVPPRTEHEVHNADEGELRYLFVAAPVR